MTAILNARNVEPSVGRPVVVAKVASLTAGSIYRWQCLYSEMDTTNTANMQYEGPYLRISPSSPCFYGKGQVTGAYTTFDGRDVSGATATNPRAVVVTGTAGVNEAQSDGKFYYEIDALPGGSFIAPFDCELEFVAYAPGYWVFGGGMESCGEDDMAPHLALVRIGTGAARVYSQTRWCNNLQNLNGLGAGVRRLAIPNGAYAFRDIGVRNTGVASYDLIGEESPSSFDTNEIIVNGAGLVPGEIPTGNARYIIMRCTTAAPERAGIAFQIRVG
jgi:hypothetical protein